MFVYYELIFFDTFSGIILFTIVIVTNLAQASF